MSGFYWFHEMKRPPDEAELISGIIFAVLLVFWVASMLLLILQVCGVVLERHQPGQWPLMLVVLFSIMLAGWLLVSWRRFERANTSYRRCRHSGSRRRRFRVEIY